MPFNKLNEWFNQEKELGLEVNNTVLSTISPTGFPHSRVVAIREIKNGSFIFLRNEKPEKSLIC